MKETIAVWFSCGAASAVASKLTVEQYSRTHNVLIVNNPVDEEHVDNRRFLKDIQEWVGIQILSAVNSELNHCSARRVWEQKKYMSGIHGAPCTGLLKKEARYEFEKKNKIDWHVLGFTLDEIGRHEKFTRTERANTLPILINKQLTKKDCFKILKNANIELPEIYKMGYANANCVGCVKATSPTYWNLVRKTHPEVFRDRAEQSREIGCKLVRLSGRRLFLDELPKDAIGAKMKSYECGIFCDTK